MENKEEQIGDKIAKLRKENNLSQEKLAEKLDVSRQTVYQWECNAQLPKTDKLILLCKLFGKNITYFIPPTENETKNDDSCQQPTVLDDKNNTPLAPNSHKKHKILLIFSIIITSLLLIISLYFTVTNGKIAYTNNTGDLMDNTANIDYEEFFISLAITITLLVLDLFCIIFIVKRNVNKN